MTNVYASFAHLQKLLTSTQVLQQFQTASDLMRKNQAELASLVTTAQELESYRPQIADAAAQMTKGTEDIRAALAKQQVDVGTAMASVLVDVQKQRAEIRSAFEQLSKSYKEVAASASSQLIEVGKTITAGQSSWASLGPQMAQLAIAMPSFQSDVAKAFEKFGRQGSLTSAIDQYQQLLGASMPAHVFTEARKVAAVIDQRPTPSAASRVSEPMTIETAVVAAIKGGTGADLNFHSPEMVIQFIAWLLVLIFMQGLKPVADSAVAETDRALGAHRQTTADRKVENLASALTAVGNKLDVVLQDRGPVVISRVTRPSVLRDGPASTAGKLADLLPGQLVRVIDESDGWKFVEPLTLSGEVSGGGGWIYGSRVRYERSADFARAR